MYQIGDWLWSIEHRQPCRVMDTTPLWGEPTFQVWLSGTDSVIRTTAERLSSLAASPSTGTAHIRYVAHAARIADLLNEEVLLAPATASVIPLPHQLKALRSAISQDRVRYLLADEVGLGKTIEAGLIMRELKLRGLVQRILVIAPKGLVTQWVAEMQTHFGEEFRYFAPADFGGYRRIAPEENVWRTYHQVICSLDSVKPMEARQGWSSEELQAYNKDRYEDLVTAGWDLIVVDEAHRIGGSSDQVARHQLGRGLAEASPYLLLLSATPHQGKSDAFHRLVSLLDDKAFPDLESVTKESIAPYVIRTEKRQAIDAEGKPLFKPRITKLVGIGWEEHPEQEQLYEAVSEYVRVGYDQAILEKKTHVSFLLILMQRLVTSSTRAIITTLERRLDALQQPGEQLSLLPQFGEEEWNDMDGQDQLDAMLKTRLKALDNEQAEVQLLLNAAKRVEAKGPDAKAVALLEWIYRFQQEESDPDVKLLVFTEFVPTQQMLAEFLGSKGISVVWLNGDLSMKQRQHVQTAFANDARILISTDAGGEGLNLQFCHIVINYDIPWNPMRLEQRIGRVDRIGQKAVVRAINFLFTDSVEFRVRDVLENKLAVILKEFGVDKTSDVLDSAEAANLFDDLYLEALIHPDKIEESVEQVAASIKSKASEAHERNRMLSTTADLSPEEARLAMSVPIGEWVERMTENYLDAFGGRYDLELDTWRIQWPGETEKKRYALPSRSTIPPDGAEMLRLDHPKVQGMFAQLPRFVHGMPITTVHIPALPSNVSGFWSLWDLRLNAGDTRKRRVVPLFVHDDGRALAPTARYVWEQLCLDQWHPADPEEILLTTSAYAAIRSMAEAQCRDIYLDMREQYLQNLELEKGKAEHSFRSRRKVLRLIGLPAVRDHRLRLLDAEEALSIEDMERRSRVLPDLVPLIMLQIV